MASAYTFRIQSSQIAWHERDSISAGSALAAAKANGKWLGYFQRIAEAIDGRAARSALQIN
jgi:hypothetical protein